MTKQQQSPSSRKNFGPKMTSRQLLTARRLAVVFAVLVITAVSMAARTDERIPPKQTAMEDAQALPVQTTTVTEVDSYQRPRTFTGLIQPARQSELSFKRAEELIEVFVDQGQRVDKGHKLAQLETRSLEVKRQQFQAQLDEALAVLAELERGPREEKIAAQRATVEDLKAQVALQERQLDRRRDLLKGNATSKESVEQALFGLDSGRARLAAAEQQLDELLAGTRRERIDAQSAVVKQLEASLRDIQIDIEDSLLLAPYDGYVTKRYTDEGTIVSPAQPLFRIVEDSPVEAWVGLPPSAASRLEVGQEYQLTIEGELQQAVIKSVLAELDGATRTRTVVLTLPSVTPAQIVPGEVVRIEVEQRVAARGFWVPTPALTRAGRGLWSVLVIQQDDAGRQTVQRRDVEVIYTNGERSLVRGTLVDGDRVVGRGTHRLVAGQRVTTHEG